MTRAGGPLHRGFTLIELLVVLTVSGIVMAFAAVALGHSRSGARQAAQLFSQDLAQARPAPSIGGAIAVDDIDVDGMLTGSPASQLWSGDHAQFLTQMGLRWDVLTDPAFPVDFEDVRPDFGALPSDFFPVLRINGNQHFSASWNGRGVLIVTGAFDANPSFHWDGIVLAGWIDGRIAGDVDGILVGGFSSTQPHTLVETDGDIRYHSCNVSRANGALSYLELIQNTIFEVR